MLFEKFFQNAKLRQRALKYKNKDDIGGIKYVLENVRNENVVFDIGAHKGGYLYFFKKIVGTTGSIYAFEPQTVLFNYLIKLKNLFKWTNVTVEHIALSDKYDKVKLYLPSAKSKKSAPGATIIEHPERTDMEAIEEVTTNTLDEYCERNNIKPDFLKIDVEGNELKIFNGALHVLKKYKPKILVEVELGHAGMENALSTFTLLQDLGYKGYFLNNDKKIGIAEFSFEKYQNRSIGVYCNNFVFE